MRRITVLTVMLVGLMILFTGIVLADNGPHTGNFTTTTDACAGCHRAHRGQAANLLTETSQQALCYSCHDTTGTGADTNVEDGVYEGTADGTTGDGLRGGGFANALMDTDVDGTPASAAVTSKHNVGSAGTIWGSGAIGSGAGTATTLECGSCHNPHGISGGDTYRVLRPTPNDGSGAVSVPDEGTINYTITYQGNNYRDATYMTDTMSAWCATCHTRYNSSSFGDSGDPIFMYRHKTNGSRQCLVCHVAHGTSASMGTFSDSVEWPDSSAASSGANSRLLHVDSRGVCIQCHPSP